MGWNQEPDIVMEDWGQPQAWLNSINSKKKDELVQWVLGADIELNQINGQRIYGGPPPGWVGDVPPLGSEVFIGNLPQEIYEDTLIPLFQSVGKLYEFRLMMTFSGLNRGFAYARYSSKHFAEQAIVQLAGFEIKPGCKITVCRSTEKSEITLDGLPGFLEKDAIVKILEESTTGIHTVSLYASPTANSKNMAVVKYISHRTAALAKKRLCEGVQVICGYPFTVDWLQPSVRQKLQVATMAKPSFLPPKMTPAAEVAQEKLTPSAVQCLQLLCDNMKLGQPLYHIKFLTLGTHGWLRFRYWVQIPMRPVPFTGYCWLAGDKLIPTDKYQQAKEMVALQILKELGYIAD
ncbi:dead end protein homolog 1 [Leptodactylus fuscus]|uniref:dead end protein homolog 1 n=1 Tax=Leptodactylus fuscus TaxID=238119 RepID=UPI003F4E7952